MGLWVGDIQPIRVCKKKTNEWSHRMGVGVAHGGKGRFWRQQHVSWGHPLPGCAAVGRGG